MKSKTLGAPISRVFGEKLGPTTPTTLEPIHRFVSSSEVPRLPKEGKHGHPSLKVSAPLPRGNEIPVPSLRRTQRQDGSQQMLHIHIRKSLCRECWQTAFTEIRSPPIRAVKVFSKLPRHQLAAPPAPFNPLFPHVLPVPHVCDTAD